MYELVDEMTMLGHKEWLRETTRVTSNKNRTKIDYIKCIKVVPSVLNSKFNISSST